MQPEWGGSIFTSLNALSNQDRLALWLWKRGNKPLYFNYWRRIFWHVAG